MLDLSSYSELMSRAEVAAVLRVSYGRVCYLTDRGLIRSRRVGKNVAVPKSAVEEFLSGSDVAPSESA